jgi:hypothetical protein
MDLICHSEPLSITHQILLARFIEFTLKNETISQFHVKGKELINRLVKFADEYGMDD